MAFERFTPTDMPSKAATKDKCVATLITMTPQVMPASE